MKKAILASAIALIFAPPLFAADCSNLAVWDSATAYGGGTEVQHQGDIYKANWWTQGQDPAANSGDWQEWSWVSACDVIGTLPPEITVTSPQAGGQFVEGSTIVLAVDVKDAVHSITEVQFSVNGNRIGSVLSAPYELPWVAVVGNASIEATVFSDSGLSSSDTVSVTVTAAGGNQPPQVAVTAPSDGAQLTDGTQITFTADASDADGAVDRVEFYLNDVLVGDDTVAPYTLTWPAVIGNYALYARAIDNELAATTSSVVSFSVKGEVSGGGCAGVPTYVAGQNYAAGDVVQVDNYSYRCDVAGWCSSDAAWAYAPGTGAHWQDAWTEQGICAITPEVSFTSPAPGSVLLAGVPVTVGVDATDGDGSVTGVEFKAGATTIGSAISTPYQVEWQPSTIGNTVLTAIATDNEGNKGESQIQVSVTDQPLVVSLTSPSSGDSIALGKTVALAADAAALTGGVAKVDFLVNGSIVATDTVAPFDGVWTPAAAGSYSVAAQVTDSAGSTALSDAASVSVRAISGKRHQLIGYWHNFVNGAGCPMNLSEMSKDWDVIDIAFADNDRNSNGTVHFNLYNGDIYSDCAPIDPVRFKADIKALQAEGKVFVLSLGGAEGTITLNTDSDEANFVSSLTDIIKEWGFDGLDIDLESGSNLVHGSQIQARLPRALKQIEANTGGDMYLTMAPEHPYVQGGMVAYSGIWGAYIPLIDELRGTLDLLHVQLYNNGGLANPYTNGAAPEGSVDMMVASAKMLVEGFEKADGTWFSPLRDDQVAIGLPSGPSSANSGQAPIQNIVDALDCLTLGQKCSSVVPTKLYPNFGGVMTWSINWDQHDGFNFSGPVGQKLTEMNAR
ncbi:Ig-like domain-containing protein [Thaumasiovibrio subtropicus]|uniref:Ig-like domain-containing protein n=1 Tax=Thaumasiovibrio subtropicus TaxID=1891207 RepID=UPI000B3514CC|nr:Ig-like domain-containing protein [Thaumasiovibrio subtropicus]